MVSLFGFALIEAAIMRSIDEMFQGMDGAEERLMKLWVDYTNHNGKRAWREIENPTEPLYGAYTGHETWCMGVYMVDRERSYRRLALDQIHGFHVGDEAPQPPRGGVSDEEVEAALSAPLPYGKVVEDWFQEPRRAGQFRSVMRTALEAARAVKEPT